MKSSKIAQREPRNHRNQSTYKYLHPPGRRGANIRISVPARGERLSAACRTGVRQRGAGGTDAKQEQRPRSKATLDPHKLSTQPDESTHTRPRRRRGLPTSLQL